MLFRAFLLTGIIFVSFKTVAEPQAKVPHELREFYNKLENQLGDLEGGLTAPEQRETSLAHKFLVTVLNQLFSSQSKTKKSSDELVLTKALKKKVESLLRKNSESIITLETIAEVIKEFSNEFSDEEKIDLAALIMVDGEKSLIQTKDQEVAIKSLIQKYESDPVLKSETSDEEKGFKRLTTLINKALIRPESLDSLLTPLKEQVFEKEKNAFSMLNPLTQIPSFKDAITNLNNLKSQNESSQSNSINLGNHPISGKNQLGRTAPRNFLSGNKETTEINATPTPDVQDTPELKACVDHSRQKRFNVELGLPGSLCASTPIARDPEVTKKGFTKNSKGFCEVDLASATHCAVGAGKLSERIITAKVGGKSVKARIIRSGTVDELNGAPFQNGNPDLMVFKVELPCSAASQLEIARIPSPEEVHELFRTETLPIVLQQNSMINASAQGNNQATIAGTGMFERTANGGVGNFLKFNTNSRFNKSSGLDSGPISRFSGLVFDSNRIKEGDSGGAALTCKFDDNKKVKEVLFLGAISHIIIRGDYDEGKEGGIASGASLLSLSRTAWGDERVAKNRGSVLSNNRASHD